MIDIRHYRELLIRMRNIMSFFWKTANVLREAARVSMVDTARATAGAGIVFSGYSLYNKFPSSVSSSTFFRTTQSKAPVNNEQEQKNLDQCKFTVR